ncbi:MAG: hypothetical protein IPL12_21060 [Bacteroidetes bacterium]|nr:hypothetical protein [Bacteroidota bacterium]
MQEPIMQFYFTMKMAVISVGANGPSPVTSAIKVSVWDISAIATFDAHLKVYPEFHPHPNF